MGQPANIDRLAEILSRATRCERDDAKRRLLDEPLVAEFLMRYEERTLFFSAGRHPAAASLSPREWVGAADAYQKAEDEKRAREEAQRWMDFYRFRAEQPDSGTDWTATRKNHGGNAGRVEP